MGASLYGGRWNPKGFQAIYAAETMSLAVLEVLVHFSVLPRDFIMTEIRITAGVTIEAFSKDELPPDWYGWSPSVATQKVGREWIVNLRSAVLSVPSAIIHGERNYVLNPDHPDFKRIKFLPSTPFQFDPRLK